MMEHKVKIGIQEIPYDGIRKEQKKDSLGLSMEEEVIMKNKEEKDLGVVIQDTLSPEQHISKLFGSMYKMLTNIKVPFQYRLGI